MWRSGWLWWSWCHVANTELMGLDWDVKAETGKRGCENDAWVV